MAKNRVVIEGSFKAVTEAGYETVARARETWLEVAGETAEKRANDQAASRGYELQVGIDRERVGHQSARISAVTHTSKWGDDPWILRYFEYGTTRIAAMPFMRPAARKANKAFVAEMGAHLEGNIRKRSRGRRRRVS